MRQCTANKREQGAMMFHTYFASPAASAKCVSPAIRHIILPLEGSRLAERAVEPALVLARAFNADVALVRCYEPAVHPPSTNAGWAFLGRKASMPLHAASLYLARIEETFRQRGVRAHAHLFQWPVTSAILDTAIDNSDALIVMAARAESDDAHRLEGVATEVVDAAATPVLLLPTDTRVVFAGSRRRGMRILAIGGNVAFEVEAYAQMLAEAFRGTIEHASFEGQEKGNTSARTAQLAKTARAIADVVVLKEAPQLDGCESGSGGRNVVNMLLAAGLPVLMVP